jgi:hypothetical protein
MCLRVSNKKEKLRKKYFFASLKFTEERSRIRSWFGFGSISQKYGSADPDPHQHVTDRQHYLLSQGSTVLGAFGDQG